MFLFRMFSQPRHAGIQRRTEMASPTTKYNPTPTSARYGTTVETPGIQVRHLRRITGKRL